MRDVDYNTVLYSPVLDAADDSADAESSASVSDTKTAFSYCDSQPEGISGLCQRSASSKDGDGVLYCAVLCFVPGKHPGIRLESGPTR